MVEDGKTVHIRVGAANMGCEANHNGARRVGTPELSALARCEDLLGGNLGLNWIPATSPGPLPLYPHLTLR